MKKISLILAVVLCDSCKLAVQLARLHGSLKELNRDIVEIYYDSCTSSKEMK